MDAEVRDLAVGVVALHQLAVLLRGDVVLGVLVGEERMDRRPHVRAVGRGPGVVGQRRVVRVGVDDDPVEVCAERLCLGQELREVRRLADVDRVRGPRAPRIASMNGRQLVSPSALYSPS